MIWGLLGGRLAYNIFSISKSLLLYMFCGLNGCFGWSFLVFFFDCFSLSNGLMLVLFSLILGLLFALLFGFLFMGFFLHFGLFVLFLHFFSIFLHLFLMLLLHFFFRGLDLRIRQFFLRIDWPFSPFLSSSSGWQRMYWFFICWLLYLSFINDRGFRIMNGSWFVIVHLLVTCMFLLLLCVLLSFFFLVLILMRFCRFFLNNHAFIVQVGGADSISSSCGGFDLDILPIGALTGI